MRNSFCYAAALSMCLSGCAATEYISRTIPSGSAAEVHLYSRNEEVTSNLIDRALAACPDGTEAAATVCVREALSASPMSVRALASSIPGCAMGSFCTYEHTTRRRLGLISMYATMVKRDWVVTIDLRQARTDLALLPVAVRDRNVFVAAPTKGVSTVPAAAPAH